MKILKTVRILAPGVAVGRAYLPENHIKRPSVSEVPAAPDPAQETELFEAALRDAVEHMRDLAAGGAASAAPDKLVSDALFVGAVKEKIGKEEMPAGQALQSTCRTLGDMLSGSGDEYFRRAADSLAEACSRISDILENGPGQNPFAGMPQGSVVVADGLTLRDTELMDFADVAGFILTDRDALDSIGIVARAKGVPAVAVPQDERVSIADGEAVALDASRGEVILSPDRETEESYLLLAEDYREENRRLSGIGLPGAVTSDGRRVTVLASAASVNEVRSAVEAGADGIGMLESGFSGSSAFEEEMFDIYRKCVRICGQRPLIIRAVTPAAFRNDEAGEPEISSEMLEAQLRAILRAGRFGNVKLLFPSVESVDEFRFRASVLEKCRERLNDEGAEYDETMAVGVTIDAPTAVLIADALASEARFVCLAADGLAAGMGGGKGGRRTDTQPGYFLTASVVRAVKAVADSSAAAGADCELCGVAASDTRITALLLGLGVDTLCVEAGDIGSLKRHIESLNYADCRALAFRALGTVSDAQMEKLVF